MSLSIKLHGVRGSRPTHKLGLLGFGGNSTSMEFNIGEKFYLFLDAGSGLVRRGQEISSAPEYKDFHFLITHTHWDHMLGMPFFEPIYNKSCNFTFYASNTSKAKFDDLLLSQNRRESLPVPPAEIKARFKFKQVSPGECFSIGPNVVVRTLQLNHQGITLGYRVEHEGRSICVITDNAPIENGNYMGEGMKDRAKSDPRAFESGFENELVDFLRNADVVVFDTHFTEANLKADWGHSTPPRALDFCRRAKAKHLVLFHHAPEDLDSDVVAKVDSIRSDAQKFGIQIDAAVEGGVWPRASA